MPKNGSLVIVEPLAFMPLFQVQSMAPPWFRVKRSVHACKGNGYAAATVGSLALERGVDRRILGLSRRRGEQANDRDSNGQGSER